MGDCSVHDSQDDVEISFTPASNVILDVDIDLGRSSGKYHVSQYFYSTNIFNPEEKVAVLVRSFVVSNPHPNSIPFHFVFLELELEIHKQYSFENIHTLAYPVSLLTRVDPAAAACRYFSAFWRISPMSSGTPTYIKK